MVRFAWIQDSVCGCAFGIVKGLTGEACLTSSSSEVEEIALDKFANVATPEILEAGVVVTAARLVCTKSFKHRFADVLTGACMNLVGC